MCCAQYQLCPGEDQAWSLDAGTDSGDAGKTGEDCTEDYVVIRKFHYSFSFYSLCNR